MPVTFLQPCKKVTKEDGIGEALTAKPIGTAFIVPLFFPGFEPPSPMYPFRRWSEEWQLSDSPETNSSRITIMQLGIDHKNEQNESFDGGRVRVWGRAAQSRDIQVSLPPK